MKIIFFAAALTLGGAAMAQDATETTPPMTSMTVAPDNSAPERDARGIPVISAPASAPAGWNQGPTMVPAGAAPPAPPAAGPMGSATDLPPCTRTVTDRCVQTYERNRGPGG